MRYCRFSSPRGPQFGLVEALAGVENITYLLALAQAGMPGLENPQKIAPMPLASVRLLPPVEPSKIVCVGRNYADHAKELGNEVPVEPLIFLKPPSSMIPHGDKIVRPKISQRVDFEGELALIVSKPCRNLRDNDPVAPYIFGYTCANEVTARDLQKKDGQWTRAKGYDTFCPVGPLVTTEGVDPWKGVQVETRVNGVVKQSASTSSFIFPLDVLIRYISRFMTLVRGDLILT